ncbi:MAG: hypothetical protein WD557_20315 [Dehalococcoidia bacterium]
MAAINTDLASRAHRARGWNPKTSQILLARIAGSEQEKDLTAPPNCGGLGRIRHFRRATQEGWPPNPLPIDPATKALGLPRTDELNAQVFQNAACNWRCWYCYVPFELLSAKEHLGEWVTADEMVDLFLSEANHPHVLDLTGGQPDLVPEWIPRTMEALLDRDAENSVFLWSDDNLSNDYFWRYLSAADIDLVSSYRNYAKVCCFKGFDAPSFAFNTGTDPEGFEAQFELFSRYLEINVDLYAYVTLTGTEMDRLSHRISGFIDRLQAVHSLLPLRTIPLEIRVFSTVVERVGARETDALGVQQLAIAAWTKEITRRFTAAERALPITEVPLRTRRTIRDVG